MSVEHVTPERSLSFEVDDAALERAIDHLMALIDRPSESGREGPAIDEAERIARADLDLPVRRMPVGPERDNLLVGAPTPRVLLCTHLDTAPPHRPARRDARFVFGRGAADAKGPAVAMLHALTLLRSVDLAHEVGCLLVVGEESDHAGARAVVASDLRPEIIILGEPCGLEPASAQKGILKLRFRARGCAGHSAYPEVGVSAVHQLLSALQAIRDHPLPADRSMGPTTVNVGRIEGGVACNLTASEAEALVLVRCAAPCDAILADIRDHVAGLAEVEELDRSEPMDFEPPPHSARPPVPFHTDAHALAPLGARLLLMGPGDMRCAHADREHLPVEEFRAGIAAYARVAARLV